MTVTPEVTSWTEAIALVRRANASSLFRSQLGSPMGEDRLNLMRAD